MVNTLPIPTLLPATATWNTTVTMINTGPDYSQVIIVWVLYVIFMIIGIVYLNNYITEYRRKIKEEKLIKGEVK